MELKNKTKPIRIAFNMLCCAALFCWTDVKPRETISGLFGRKVHEPFNAGHGIGHFWLTGLRLIDAMHFREEFHCANTAACEAEARECLGYCE